MEGTDRNETEVFTAVDKYIAKRNNRESSTFSTGLMFLLPACGRTRSVHLTGHKRGEALQKRETGVVRKLG